MFSVKKASIVLLYSLCVVLLAVKVNIVVGQDSVHESDPEFVVTSSGDPGLSAASVDIVEDDKTGKVAVAVEDGAAEPETSVGVAPNDVPSVDPAVTSIQNAEEENLERFAEGSVVEVEESRSVGLPDETVGDGSGACEVTPEGEGACRVADDNDASAADDVPASDSRSEEDVAVLDSAAGRGAVAESNDEAPVGDDPANEKQEESGSAMGNDMAAGSPTENDETRGSVMGDHETVDRATLGDLVDRSAEQREMDGITTRDVEAAESAGSSEVSAPDVVAISGDAQADNSEPERSSETDLKEAIRADVEESLDNQEDPAAKEAAEGSREEPEVSRGLDDATERLLAESKEALHAMNLELETVRRQAADFEADLHGAHVEISSMKQQTMMFEREMQLLVDLIDAAGGKEAVPRLQGDANDALEKMEQFEAEAKHAREEGDAMKSKLEAAEGEVTKLRDRLSAADGDIAKGRLHMEELQQANEELRELNKELRKVNEELREANDELKAKVVNAEEELARARVPREVSVKAITADVNELRMNTMGLAVELWDDVVLATKTEYVKIREVLEPHWEAARDEAAPWVEKGLKVSAPHRAYAIGLVREYMHLLEENVVAPAKELFLVAEMSAEVELQKVSKAYGDVEFAVIHRLKRLGVKEVETRRIIKFANIAVLSMLVILFVVYLGGSVLRYVVLPLLRLAARILLWLLKLPFRVLLFPVWLIFFCVKLVWRLVFGRSRKVSARKGAVATGTSKRKNKNKHKRE